MTSPSAATVGIQAAAKPETDSAIFLTEDGRCWTGRPYGARGQTLGEAVFTTGMTGYQETLTDPSYYGQVVVMTAPHIGNTGVNDQDGESSRIWVSGYVVRDPAPRASNWRATGELETALADAEVVGISGIDTRSVTRHLRERGAMRCGIFSGPDAQRPHEELLRIVRDSPGMAGAALTEYVTTKAPYVVSAAGEKRFTVAAIDVGIKTMTPHQFSLRGIETHVLPANCSIEDITSREVDGVFFSNGPGDPATAQHSIELLQEVLRRKIPFFGICFGHQLFGRALGFETYKLRFGHRGINQPVADRRTGKVEITAHNHGFAVQADPDQVADTPFGRVEVSHVCLNDNVVEGLRCLDIPAFSVQYHPEAAAGPHDADYLFDEFVTMMQGAQS